MALFEDLILCYPLDSDATDLQSGYNGTETSVSYVAGTVGNAADFNGTSSKISVGRVPDIEGLETYTIGFWVYIDSYPSSGDSRQIFRYYNGVSSYLSVYLSASYFEVYLREDASNYSYRQFSSTNVPAGSWLCVILKVSSGAVQSPIYVNNVAKGSAGIPSSNGTPAIPSGAGSTLDIGSKGSSQYFDGRLDHLCFWGSQLSTGDGSAFYNSGAGLAWPMGGVVLPQAFTTTDSISGNGYPNQIQVGAFVSTDTIVGIPVDSEVDIIYFHDINYTAWKMAGNPISLIDTYYTAGSMFYAVDSVGNYYTVYVTTSDYIRKYNAAGEYQWAYQVVSGDVNRMALDIAGDYLYFTNGYVGQQIGKINTSTGLEVTSGGWPKTGISETLNSIQFGIDGYIYTLGDGTRLYKIDPADASTIWGYSVSNGINAFAVNATGAVALGCCFFGNTGDTLKKLTSAGALSWSLAPCGVNMPVNAVAIDASGNVLFFAQYAASGFDTGVGKYSADGSTQLWFNAGNVGTQEAKQYSKLFFSVADSGYFYGVHYASGTGQGLWKHLASDGSAVWNYKQPEGQAGYYSYHIMPGPVHAWKIYLSAGVNGSICDAQGVAFGDMVEFPAGENLDLYVTGDAGYAPDLIILDSVEQL